jgi:hypothetical protein
MPGCAVNAWELQQREDWYEFVDGDGALWMVLPAGARLRSGEVLPWSLQRDSRDFGAAVGGFFPTPEAAVAAVRSGALAERQAEFDAFKARRGGAS